MSLALAFNHLDLSMPERFPGDDSFGCLSSEAIGSMPFLTDGYRKELLNRKSLKIRKCLTLNPNLLFR